MSARSIAVLLLAPAALALSCASPRATATPSAPLALPPRAHGPVAAPAYGAEGQVTLAAPEREALATAPGLVPSAALVRAARLLARRAADGDASPIAAGSVRAALDAAAVADPAPSAVLVSGDAAHVAELVGARLDRGATHAGVGVELRGSRGWAVALTARRQVRLEPFPREVAPGDERALRGELIGLAGARVEVTLPSGEVREAGASGGAAFDVTIRFETPGRYVLEVVGDGPRGPEVAAILAVDAGALAPVAVRAAPTADPDDLAAAEARVEDALDALRARHGLPPLARDPALKEVARRHSAGMVAAGVLAHVLPGTGDLRARLQRARIPYRRALENVAKAASALEAHLVAEESPAHRRNMLDAGVRRVGVGAARASGGDAVYLTEIFVEAAPARSAEGAEVEVRLAVARARAREGGAPLAPDPELDALARAQARRMARVGALAERELADRALDLGRRRVSAAEALLSSSPDDAGRSPHAGDWRFRRLGVGVSPAEDGRLWIAVVYTD